MTEFESIYRTYFRDVFLYIQGLSRDEHIAEEVTQETFFHALRAVKDFRGDCDIRVWLCQIAKNEYYTYLRKNKRLVTTDFSEDRGGRGDDPPRTGAWISGGSNTAVSDPSSMGYLMPQIVGNDLEQKIVDSETAVRIHKLLHEMQEPYKEVFQLRVFGELSFEQIGDIFGRTANWACVTYHRAKAKIQKEMEET